MFRFLGRLTATYPSTICMLWVVADLALAWLAPTWDSRAVDDDIHFLPQRCASVRGFQLLEQAFPQDVFASRVVLALERADGPLTEADFALADQCVTDLNRLRTDEPDLQIVRIYSHRDPVIGKRLVSADGRCTLIQAALGSPFLALQTQATVDRLEERVLPLLSGPNAPRLFVTGPAGIGRDLVHASSASLESTTWATILLVVVILLFVYRAPLLALVPLITIALSVWVALNLLALLTLIPGVYLVNVSKVFAVVLLYGAGTDYCLFLISRYREEISEGHVPREALRRSVGTVGGALAASAGTVICGLGMMGLAEFAKVRCAGPAIALGLLVALAASLTLTPALLHLLGRRVFWPIGLPKKATGAEDPDLWTRISRNVVKKPVLIWGLAVAGLIPLALLGLRVRPTFRPTSELSPSSSSIQGLAAIQSHFTAGETGPVTVLLVSSTDWTSLEGRRLIAHLSNGFAALDNVAEVRSLTQPLGQIKSDSATTAEKSKNPVGFLNKFLDKAPCGADLIRAQVERTSKDFYVASLPFDGQSSRFATRLDVVLRTDPFASKSMDTLNVIQTWLDEALPAAAGNLKVLQAETYGVTVNARDLSGVVASDQARINLLVLGAVFLILLALVRRPWLAVYLLLTVLLSYYATLGATAIMGSVWYGRSLGEVDWRVPFFLFTILVAVGEDYNILLITRALQEHKRHGITEGTRRALARTGGTITSCGLIMAGTFGTLMLGGLGTLIQIGFALAFGVILDTLVVRPFLVPAFALLVWRHSEQPKLLRPMSARRSRLPRRVA
ncbi:MAG: MMPL family transporter [Gemmataceae bacterium]